MQIRQQLSFHTHVSSKRLNFAVNCSLESPASVKVRTRVRVCFSITAFRFFIFEFFLSLRSLYLSLFSPWIFGGALSCVCALN